MASNSLALAEVLDLNEATALHGKLMALRGKDVELDASGVKRMGAQCVQVILSAKKLWDEDKKTLKVGDASDSFKATMQLIGIKLEPLLA